MALNSQSSCLSFLSPEITTYHSTSNRSILKEPTSNLALLCDKKASNSGQSYLKLEVQCQWPSRPDMWVAGIRQRILVREKLQNQAILVSEHALGFP